MKFNLWKLDDHPELVSALFAAHREAAIANDNASKLCVQQAWGGSGRFENAIIAGMATIGALHAPLVTARDLWERPILEQKRAIRIIANSHQRVPGFGNSFHVRGDPAFAPVLGCLHDKYRNHNAALSVLCGLVHAEIGEIEAGTFLHPNAALYTAIVASICEVPRGLEPALFAMARIPAWAELCGAVQHPRVGGVR